MFRTHATFDGAFPDDGEWNADGTPMKPAGENVTSALRAGLMVSGICCSDILQRSFYGWEFDYDVEGTPFLCVVQPYEDGQWLLICEPRISVLRRIFSQPSDDILAAGLTTMHNVLTSNTYFSNVRWHDREQFEKGGSLGAPAPI